MKDLIENKIVFTCPYCGKESVNYDDILNCLDMHNIIFAIEEPDYSHDCWGNNTTDYCEKGKMFKKYKDAYAYCEGKDMKIKIKELS